jgi:hypothetical protein
LQSETLAEILAKVDPEAIQAWQDALQQAVEQGALSPQQFAELREQGWPPPESGMCEGAPQQMSLADAGQLANLAADLQCQLDQMAEGANAAGLGAALAMGLGEGGNFSLMMLMPEGAGFGGITRGGGSAPLSQGAAEPFAVGDALLLPQATKINPDGSITLSEVQRDPDLDEEALRAASRAQLQQWDAAAADARRVRVSPQHRGAVEAYFADE